MNHKLLLCISAFLCVLIRAHAQGDDPDAFITTWQTDACTEADRWGLDINEVYLDKIINLPIVQGERGTYDFTVDWGDGTQRHVTGSLSTTVDTYIEVGVGYVLSEQDLDSDAFFKIEPSYVFDGIAHVYEDPGVYQVKITGSFPGIAFGGTGNPAKLLSVNQWGSNQWQTMEHAFHGCVNLEIPATDAPDLSQVTSLASMFEGYNGKVWVGVGPCLAEDVAKKPQLNISHWDVSSITNMSNLFNGSNGAFDISGWDVSKVSNMSGIFRDYDLSMEEYDAILNGWSKRSLQRGVTFSVNSAYCEGDVARGELTFLHQWIIEDEGKNCPVPEGPDLLITTWKTDNCGPSEDWIIEFPFINDSTETYDFTVYWGDGTKRHVTNQISTTVEGLYDQEPTGGRKIYPINPDDHGNQYRDLTLEKLMEITWNTAYIYRFDGVAHAYKTPGTYQVTIEGDFPDFAFNNKGDVAKLIAIDQWGNHQWKSMDHTFYGCVNLEMPATDAPDLSAATVLAGTFQGYGGLVFGVGAVPCLRDGSQIVMNIGHWDVSNITTMENVFRGSGKAFDVAGWDVSNVTDMSGLFANTGFNQDISHWDVSKVTDMSELFFAASFDQNIGDWDVTNVTNMSGMFDYSSLSTDNYDSLLIGWASQDVQEDVSFSGGGLLGHGISYCQGEAARAKLIDEYGWIIEDQGQDCPPVLVEQITVTGADEAYEGIPIQLSSVVGPEDATDVSVTYSVDDATVATIDPTTGILTAIAPGVVTVTAKANDGSGVTATKQVTVLKRIVLYYELAIASSHTLQSYGDAVSSTDLLTGITPITTGWNYNNYASSLELTDGYHGEGFQFYPADWVQGAWTTTGATAIYDLGIGANGQGYDLTSIVSIADWEGAGFGNQAWIMEVLPVGGSSYELLATVDYQPFTARQGGSTKVTIANNGEAVASGIQKIKITAHQVNGGINAGAFVWRELDVFGQPTGDVETASTSRIGSGANTLAHVTSPFKAYPTTTRHALHFEIDDFQIDEHVIKVTALDGKSWNMQPTKVEALDAEARKVTVDVAALKTGVYLLQVHTEGRVLSTRFVKQ